MSNPIIVLFSQTVEVEHSEIFFHKQGNSSNLR